MDIVQSCAQLTAEMRVRPINTLRWRHARGADGAPTRESNARFVRWSDGSMQARRARTRLPSAGFPCGGSCERASA